MLAAGLINFLSIACLIQPIISFYIPGVAPLDFKKGEDVEVKVIDDFLIIV
jgi:hypothetical protein